MKNCTATLIAALFLPGSVLAQAFECEFAPEATNPDSGETIITTRWAPIKQGTGTGIGEKRGDVRAISEGGDTYLGVKIKPWRYYPIPEHIHLGRMSGRMSEDEYQAQLRPIRQKLAKQTLVLPEGSALRITLEDRTTLTMRTEEAYRFMPEVELWKLTDKPPSFRVEYRVITRYLVDAESAALLDNNLVAALRLELPEGYFYFGHRNLTWDDRVITKRTMGTMQGVLKCVSQT